MSDRAKRIVGIYNTLLQKKASDEPRESRVQMTVEGDVMTIEKSSAGLLSSHLSGLLPLLEVELEKMDDFEHKAQDDQFQTDPRAEKVYGYMADAHENLYNAIMFLNHISDGTGD